MIDASQLARHVVLLAALVPPVVAPPREPTDHPRDATPPALAASAQPARSPSVAGEWRVVWDSDIKSSGGVVERVNKRATARLLLTRRGDSVSGRWIDGLLDDASGEPGVAVRGAQHGDTLLLTTGQVRTTRGSLRVTMHGLLASGRLAGTMYVELAGLPPAPRRWEGERAKP